MKREAVAHLQAAMGLSERQACTIVAAAHTTIRYRSRRPPKLELGEKLRDLAGRRWRFGYRGCSSCCAAKESLQGSTVSIAYIGKKG